MPTEPPITPAHGFAQVVGSWRQWWRVSVVGTVDQGSVIANRREECMLSARYLFMLSMSAGIAILGLLLSSPAVVIGAMLLSPLMGPIIGLGFSLAVGDYNWLRMAGKSLAVGTLLSILLCAFVVMLSPLQTVTPEIAARTRPNLFDLLVALFSGLAGAYAMIRGREGTVVGVAIATALMPPLAVVGFGLATLNWTVFSGALLLYVTNLMTIAITAAVMARIYGFRTSLSDRQTQLQSFLIVVVFVALAVPLAISLRQIGWEAQASRAIKGEVLDGFDNRARLSQIDINFDSDPVEVSATVLTPRLLADAEQSATRAIKRELGANANVVITQYEVGTSAAAAEEAQLASASAREQEARERRIDELANRLTLAAGVTQGDLAIDRDRRRAVVSARELKGANLAVYREFESRIAATEPEWEIELRPPAKPLPRVAFAGGKPTDAGLEAFDLIVWAAKRLNMPVTLRGAEAERDMLATQLTKNNIKVTTLPGGRTGEVTARWSPPPE